MRINNIRINHFIGIRSLDAKLGDVTLFAGLNWSGKTTLQQAVRLAICRELPRVKLKKQAQFLVNDTATKAGASISVDTSLGTFEAKLTKAGKLEFGGGMDRDAIERTLSGILEPHAFGAMDDKGRRQYLCEAFGITATAERIQAALKAQEIDDETIEKIMPLVSGGTFEAAEAEAEQRCKEHRAAWKQIAGEEYGSDKAEKWVAAVDATSPEAAKKNLERRQQAEAHAAKEHQEFEAKLNTARAELAKAQHRWTCEHCGVVNEPDTETASELSAKLPEFEKSLAFLETARQNAVRDRLAAEEALRAAKAAEETAKQRTAAAQEAHQGVLLWLKVRAQVAPDGIPAALVLDARTELNNRMRKTADITGWPQVTLGADMAITAGNRLYELCSEAERWTADAAITEAISFLTGVKLLMLDRVDVLGPERRNDLVNWTDELVVDGVQVILGATLKGPMNIEGLTCYWIQAGELMPVEEAA